MKEETKLLIAFIAGLTVVGVFSFLIFYNLATEVILTCSVVDLTTIRIGTAIIGSLVSVAVAALIVVKKCSD